MLYLVSFEAEVHVQVEADSEQQAESAALTAFKWTDVQIIGTLDVENLSGDDEDE